MALQPRGENDLRGLKALVGFLGVLIILGTALVIGTVIHRIYGKPAARAPGIIPGVETAGVLPAPVSAGLPVASGLLAHGEHIGGIAGAGGQVAIWVTGTNGDRILLLDPSTGKVSVAIQAAP